MFFNLFNKVLITNDIMTKTGKSTKKKLLHIMGYKGGEKIDITKRIYYDVARFKPVFFKDNERALFFS